MFLVIILNLNIAGKILTIIFKTIAIIRSNIDEYKTEQR